MRKKTYKGRCEKRKLEKFEGICKTYDPIQYAYADILSAKEDVVSVRCNVWLDGEECSEYMTDFLCTMANGDLMVRECISRKLVTKPQTAALLDLSQTYWKNRGIKDWGLVIDRRLHYEIWLLSNIDPNTEYRTPSSEHFGCIP